MQCCGMPGTFRRHCSQSCVYSDKTTWHPRWKVLIENPWKCHFRDSKFQNAPSTSALKNLCLCSEFQSHLLFIITQLLKNRVRTLFWTKTSRTLQGLSRTHFAFFKDSIQCKKEIWVYVFFSSTTTWAILSWRSFILGTWESGLDKVSTEIQGLSSNDYNFQGLSRTFKVRANPVKTFWQLWVLNTSDLKSNVQSLL